MIIRIRLEEKNAIHALLSDQTIGQKQRKINEKRRWKEQDEYADYIIEWHAHIYDRIKETVAQISSKK